MAERVSSSPDERPDVAEERPSRKLGVRSAALGVALLVLRQVFDPFRKGNQFNLVVFLTSLVPLHPGSEQALRG